MANTPSPQNYTLGKGVLYFDKYDSSAGTYEGARDMGNSPEVGINISPEKLEHYNSRGGLRVKDKSVVAEMNMKLSFTLDEPNAENLALMFMAELEEVAQAAVTAGTLDIASAKLGRYYDLGTRGITAESVEVDVDPEGTPVTKTEGTDYVIDYVRGRIFIPYTSTIEDADVVGVTFDAIEQTYTKLKAMQETEIEGRLIFISDNPVGVNYDLTAWRASLTPSGDLSLIGEEWMNLSYEAEIMKDETGHPTSPYMDIIKN